ncbi:MAG: chemotaxis response regulator protein-glutamate methylesterase [Methanosarcinaceae archaeon]|nr:chemotaxis response regulator protein-glutamate methylesterase [Methanosarcinaceae archaeon]
MKIHTLVVDDSALIRKVLSDILNEDPEITVIATAVNGRAAIEKVEKLKPDVVILDNIMPVLDGLNTLGYIMSECPTPVIMISALEEKAAEITLTAFEYGAVDVIQKPGGIISQSMAEIGEDICKKVKIAAKVNLKNLEFMGKYIKKEGVGENLTSTNENGLDSINIASPPLIKNIIAIGASTGGPRALEKLISAFPADLPAAVLLVQHMPANFTASFAERLNTRSALNVKEAKEGDLVESGTVLIAPGDFHMEIKRKKVNGIIREFVHLNKKEKENGARPSVNVLFRSIAPIYGSKIISMILTGMQCDGADGAGEIKKWGGKVIAEARSSCVVYGMPKEVVKRNLADSVLPLDKIAAEVMSMLK